MNILADELPKEIEVEGQTYPIDAHFRSCLKTISAYEDKTLTVQEKRELMLHNLYGDNRPPNDNEALKMAEWFLNCGDSLKESNAGPMYSLSYDAKYIRSAIEKSHRIDLDTVGFLHWWKFVYLFFDLDKDCFFNQLISLRHKQKKGKLEREEREYMAMHPEIFKLPVEKDVHLESKRNEFLDKLKGGGENGG